MKLDKINAIKAELANAGKVLAVESIDNIIRRGRVSHGDQVYGMCDDLHEIRTGLKPGSLGFSVDILKTCDVINEAFEEMENE